MPFTVNAYGTPSTVTRRGVSDALKDGASLNSTKKIRQGRNPGAVFRLRRNGAGLR